MFEIGMPELLIILVIILIIFSVGKLPQIGSALGKELRNFKTSVSDSSVIPRSPIKLKTRKKAHRSAQSLKCPHVILLHNDYHL